ncbi:gluconate 2-dehydrogenase subunit 3 family protein [Natronomonas salina]|uniref:gluconate 2-dehydrogenase subunit 3 family protein n=1 Tax=Natronomonas salina TaxID=1710540 RepID=UPI0015B62AD2|nr:gluconate 2-dehydrogenase subunit 3 family protein [Natronomonas salina]QLD89534.1 gluconate 2-dehydrogenase subunit 3 family protein [Natronomonas salina]
MELSRRDAVAALAAVGAGAGGTAYVWRRDDPEPSPDVETLTAVATVVYPSEVEGIEAFVETYAAGRAASDDDHAEGVRRATERVDARARDWYGAPFADLPPEDRDSLLREMGVDTADEDPRGTTAERVRYFVVGDLLLALYASPTGGELVGIENPQGHPGGLESYRRGP